MIERWPQGYLSAQNLPPQDERGGVVMEENVTCPGCGWILALRERHWIGGIGYQIIIACDRCEWWFKKV